MHLASNLEIDAAILEASKPRWQKVARVIVRSEMLLHNRLPDGEAGLDLIAGRVEAFVQSGHLAQGNLQEWRFS